MPVKCYCQSSYCNSVLSTSFSIKAYPESNIVADFLSTIALFEVHNGIDSKISNQKCLPTKEKVSYTNQKNNCLKKFKF